MRIVVEDLCDTWASESRQLIFLRAFLGPIHSVVPGKKEEKKCQLLRVPEFGIIFINQHKKGAFSNKYIPTGIQTQLGYTDTLNCERPRLANERR
jgi:hypothetical protein